MIKNRRGFLNGMVAAAGLTAASPANSAAQAVGGAPSGPGAPALPDYARARNAKFEYSNV